ncbi:MAG: hypothetical protein AAFV80_23190 [Bacteroidota bacterium]
MTWKEYYKKQTTTLRPYIEGEILPAHFSISEFDRQNGSPKPGDMIARSKTDPTDMWLVSAQYFKENYQLKEE